MFVQALRTPMIVLSSAQVAIDLMEKRSSLYSDKPVSIVDELSVICSLCCNDFLTLPS